MLKKRRVSVDITFGSIFWVIIFLLAVKFIANIQDVIFLIFTSVLITLAVCPLVDMLERKKINRKLSSLAILLLFFGIIIGLLASIAKPLAEQSELFVQKLPDLLANLAIFNVDVTQFTSQAVLLPSQVYRIAIDTFSGFITGFAVIVISFYMIQEMPKLQNYLEYWYGKEKGQRFFAIAQKLEEQIGNWTRGEMFLMLIIGVLSYIGYSIIGLPYVIALSVMAGILELIPNIGPTIAVIPAVLVGISISPAHALGALIVAIVTQQLENNLIVPYVMKKTAGLNPIVTIIVLMIGLRLGGPLMSVLALPIALSLRVIVSHVIVNKDTNIPELN